MPQTRASHHAGLRHQAAALACLFLRVFLVRFDGHIDRRTLLDGYLFALFVLEGVLYANLTIEILTTFNCDLCFLRFARIDRLDDLLVAQSIGIVTLDGSANVTAAQMAAAAVAPTVQIEDMRASGVSYWNPTPSGTTTLAAPTTLTATTVGFGINGANTTGGTYTGTSTYHYAIAYVDAMGEIEGQPSADFSAATAGTGATNQIGSRLRRHRLAQQGTCLTFRWRPAPTLWPTAYLLLLRSAL